MVIDDLWWPLKFISAILKLSVANIYKYTASVYLLTYLPTKMIVIMWHLVHASRRVAADAQMVITLQRSSCECDIRPWSLAFINAASRNSN